MTNIKAKLAALRAAREAATQGEWLEGQVMFGDTGEWSTLALPHHGAMNDMFKLNDANFINTAANEWTALITALERACSFIEQEASIGKPVSETTLREEEAREALTDIAKILEEK